jgi:hypothetical protein
VVNVAKVHVFVGVILIALQGLSFDGGTANDFILSVSKIAVTRILNDCGVESKAIGYYDRYFESYEDNLFWSNMTVKLPINRPKIPELVNNCL